LIARASRVAPHRRLLRALGAVAVAIILAFVARRVASDWTSLRVVADQVRVRPWFLVAAWVLQTAGWVLAVDTWRRMLGADPEPTLRTHLRIYAYSSLAHVVPGSLLAPMSRVALYRRSGVPASRAATSIVLEWLLVGLAGLLLYAVSAPFARSLPSGLALPLALAGAAGVSLSVLHPRVRGAALGLADRWVGVRGRTGAGDARPSPAPAEPIGAQRGNAEPDAGGVGSVVLVGWLAREWSVHALSGLGLYLMVRGLSIGVSLADALTAWGLAMAAANLLAWIPGTGLAKDGGMVLLLAPSIGSTGLALVAVLAWRFWMLCVQLSWAAWAAVASRAA